MTISFGAFVEGETVSVAGAANGALSGLTFAAKDVFDIAGFPTGNGQPTWLATHPVPERNAEAVGRLLDAGASLAGKSVCDEMCYNLAGDNFHYGAPINPAAPDHAVGGSSSGSAAAVAGELVDFALGTDCGGSVRCPASFSGIYGLRPTHGRAPDTGVVPLAESFDVVGWFARDARMMSTIGATLLDGEPVALSPSRALMAVDAFARLPDDERAAAETAADNLVETLGMETEPVTLAADGLDHWFDAFRHLQALEVWRNHGAWVTENRPTFGPGVKERFEYASTLTDAHRDKYQPIRDSVRARLRDLLAGNDTVIVLPSAPCSPRRDAPPAAIEDFRGRAMGLTCSAGLSGFPQLSLPLVSLKTPMGISMIGPAGADESLLSLAVRHTDDGA